MGLHPAFPRNTVTWPIARHGRLPANDLDLTIPLLSLQVSRRDMQDISPLPEASVELAIEPTEPLTQPRPLAWNRKWTAAVVVSCLLHAAVAAAFLISPTAISSFQDAEQPEGSEQSGTNVAGSALDKDPAAISVALVPSPQPAKPQPATPPKPTPPTEPSRPAGEAAKPPTKPLPEPAKQPAVTPDILVAGAPRPDDQSVAPKAETPAQPTVQPESTEVPVAVPEQPPIPSAKPVPAAAPSKTADEKRGTADGQDRLAQAASKGNKQNEAGSAAEDSYRSDVIRKLSRVNRAVPPSVQLTARNNAVVTFVIGSRGGIDELRILQSSGSPNFDQIVLGIVRKAAPFPPIPPKVGDSLVFTGAIGPF
ncbi:TonB family protein [Mesorhizobium sp. CO1-1-8]|uniref:TonB family protein n=1 Tax=Mesorhizobium sp. CO1-1-8 TaxID=2876631 RepID=UPI002961E962|nr:TonB family protein [Mesorhizobium sp. CO1-1-8]